jgi:acyl-CoA reductase-like NAD-dependent aldehyde dehydrogenase
VFRDAVLCSGIDLSAFRRFVRRKAAQLKVGDGRDPKMRMGPLANSRRIDAMEALVADAKSKGARVLAGGAGSAIAAISSLLPFSPMCRIMRVR